MSIKVLQTKIAQWYMKAFGDVLYNRKERAVRLFEEVTELCQVEGISLEMLVKNLERTYLRPVGDAQQEVSGIGITLLAYLEASEIDFEEEVLKELKRIDNNEFIVKVRAKRNSKIADGVSFDEPLQAEQ